MSYYFKQESNKNLSNYTKLMNININKNEINILII